MKKLIFRLVLVMVLVGPLLGIGAIWVYDRYFSESSKTFYCRALGCPALDDFDVLCSLAAEAEFHDFEDEKAALTWLRTEAEKAVKQGDAVPKVIDEIMMTPTSGRYPILLDAARSAGALKWQCPALERLLGGVS